MPTESPRLAEWLTTAARRLDDRLEADLLAGHVLGQSRAWLYTHADFRPDADARVRMDELLERRLAGEPVAYMLGMREFWGREFRVTPEVLIPRPETELLVEEALALDLPPRARVLDLGTGSGCLALTLAAERPAWRVTATDLCAGALAVARSNRERLGLARVALHQGDLFTPVAGRHFDLVVSNPPYVGDSDPHLERGDVRFEPRRALAAGPDGLAEIRRIVEQTPDCLNDGGWLMLEHGHDQGQAVRGLMERRGFNRLRCLPDLAGIPRAVIGRFRQSAR